MSFKKQLFFQNNQNFTIVYSEDVKLSFYLHSIPKPSIIWTYSRFLSSSSLFSSLFILNFYRLFQENDSTDINNKSYKLKIYTISNNGRNFITAMSILFFMEHFEISSEILYLKQLNTKISFTMVFQNYYM